MTYVITISPVNPRGGFIDSGNDEWMEKIISVENLPSCSSVFKGEINVEIDLRYAPDYFMLRGSRKDLPDMFWGSSQLIVVSGKYRAIIESLDPGVHQLWPMEIFDKRRRPKPQEWFGLNVRARAETIIRDGSALKISEGIESLELPPRIGLDHMKFQISVDPKIEITHHLWWDTALDEPALLCSDLFYQAVTDAGLKSIPFKKCVS